MNKFQRHQEITKLVNKKGTVRISEIMGTFGVTDMTVRRDFIELEEQGVLKKIHGGARSNSAFQYKEVSYREKHTKNPEEKLKIAKLAANLIEEEDTIFLGPSTTVEILAEEIQNTNLTVVTNCLPVFNILSKKKSVTFKVFLLGGEMRQISESFVGEITNTSLENMHFSKMFFSANGIFENDVMTSSLEEGYTQKLAIYNSLEQYLLLDSTKIGKKDFTTFCKLADLTAVVTDSEDADIINQISKYIEVISLEQ
ncbi:MULTISPECIES: DeoR/GlpR family DNA-binding transcription regulator [unclassified Gemella]|uniref:DeoR/GlpR family DNA-binding transcription regulator n=1 Tax=unclassified Gemella TaxID=2624949 RepID=UPI001C0585BD|nr:MULTISPECIES: DeoR/GlpR family DNA-binding transcription regulator [unclassified Gemella]MBU0279082.1 DeoR/GlpR family DNA-binding transcription regulator [Gemella sp. zg-1178]QWQ39112.1 DeoR/GlpR family DNA-binding transcription regulator [Gemella sp. zg-570]